VSYIWKIQFVELNNKTSNSISTTSGRLDEIFHQKFLGSQSEQNKYKKETFLHIRNHLGNSRSVRTHC
jgi:acyl-[acyl carrier protein]--UDP-N-acetylglucosamine O-acyltransferase